MENLKNSIQDITKSSEDIATNYVKLFGIRQSQRLSTFLGILSSVFIISTLLLIIIVFGSFVLADVLNNIFGNKYLGFLIVAILYLVAIAILLIKMSKTGRPLFTNLFIKFVVPLLGIEIDQKPTVDGLKIEKDILKSKIESDKSLINVHTHMLKYAFFDDFLVTIIGLFTSKSNNKESEKTASEKE